MATDAQIKANRENAKLSTGAKSESGKAKSSLNAVKTGLTGRTVLLPGEDAEAYQEHVASFFDRWKPEADDQRNLVQSLADTEWRLLRIPALEMGIYALGRLEFAAEFAKEDEAVRKHLIEAKIFLTYRKDLNNLSIQESRLRRQREKDIEALRTLKEQHRQAVKGRLNKAASLYIAAVKEGTNHEFDLGQFGFEFSIEQIEVRALEIKPNLFDAYYRELEEEERNKAA
ncbi:MAG: hypothetical protein JO138_10280 [Acidobacteriaceae bacterium]|nr:hypothetical protein [Acidobacteriota bacterium]MBV9499749.1 hypothetical protein [Acidobacteriaceae bacterium]